MKLYDLVPEIGQHTGYVDSVIDQQYPHIAEKINLFWGEPECLDYIENLINYSYDPTRQTRQGFPFSVITELYIVLKEHRKLFPKVQTNMTHRIDDPWK